MKCYLTGLQITEDNKSLEHILPNALGGKLKSKNVLCDKANLKLSKEIDTPFNKTFEIIYRRLSLEKDRPSNIGISGTHQKFNKKINLKDNKCFPVKPHYDMEENILYSKSEKVGKDYINSLKKEKIIEDNHKVKILTDLAGEIKLDFQINNEIFPLGFAKIAAGFATLQGVDRNNLKSILNLDKHEFKKEINILPFFPITSQDFMFEHEAYKSIHYPIHSIVLKGIKKDKILYCYIELFSTFQYILVLDDDYSGNDIYHNYFYDLLNSKEINYTEYFDSIINNHSLKETIINFKDFNQENLYDINNFAVFQKEELKQYCHYKFHKLESFITHINQIEKIEMLDNNIIK